MAENENMEKAALHKAIFMALPHLQKVKFAVLEVKNCNATESKPFSDVDCKFDMIKTEREEEELKNEVRPLTVNFTTLFRPGLELLTACQDENIVMEALVLLNDYFQNIGENVLLKKNHGLGFVYRPIVKAFILFLKHFRFSRRKSYQSVL